MVQEIRRLQSVLEAARRSDRERAEEREVQVPSSRAVELVSPGCPEPHAGRLCKCRRIEPLTAGPDRSEHVERAREVRRLLVAWCIQRAATCRDGEWVAAEGGQHAVDLPVVDDGSEGAIVGARGLPR